MTIDAVVVEDALVAVEVMTITVFAMVALRNVAMIAVAAAEDALVAAAVEVSAVIDVVVATAKTCRCAQ